MEQKVNISGKKGVRTISGKERAERKQQVLKLYKEGLPPKAIAYKMGRSTSLIYSIIAELKEEGKIVVNEKPFENTKVRDAVIMYMLSRRYTDREIGKFLDVSFNTIQNVKNRKETLTDEEINKIIEENESLCEEFMMDDAAEQLQMSMNGLRKVLDHLVYQGKIDPEICTKAMQEYMNDKKMKRTYERKKYHSERFVVGTVKKCRKDLQLLIKRAKSKEISEDEKAKYYELCKQIVGNGEKLTLEEIEALSDSIAYGEGKVNLEAIKFITNEYAKAENLKPALQLVNTCIAVHGESEELEKARNIVLGLYKKQAIRMCLKQGFTVEETMARAGASENEVREINRQYTQGVEQSDKNTTKKADVER